MNLVRQAEEFARQEHYYLRYDIHPFVKHLEDVITVMRRFNQTDSNLLAAAWLHDIVEDTGVSIGIVRDKFGRQIAELVDALTDGKEGNRKQRKERPYKLIPQVPGAIIVKLADRIANVEYCFNTKSPLLQMYKREYDDEYSGFRTNLYKEEEAVEMWAFLDQLMIQSMFIK